MKFPSEKFGNGCLSISVAGILYKFGGLDALFLENFRERYAPYVKDVDHADFFIEIFRGEDHYLEKDFTFLKLVAGEENGCRTITGNNFKGYGVKDGAGRVYIPPDSTPTSFLTAVENYFRWIVAHELVRRGGFLLHSSGAVKDGEAHLFFGNSGDGKSTIASFCEARGGRILSDDLVLVVPKEGRYEALGAPFCGVMPQEKKDRSSHPVKTCHRIRKSTRTAIKTISKAEALALVVPNCHYILDLKTINEALLPSVRKFLDNVSFNELLFTKDDTFWDLI